MPFSTTTCKVQRHFELRKVSLGTCGRPYGTPCKHEHACFSELLSLTFARVSSPPRRSKASLLPVPPSLGFAVLQQFADPN